MYYRHDLNYAYPERCDEHMIEVKHLCDVNFDTRFEYLNRSFGFKALRSAYWLIVNAIVFPLLRLTHGLRIYGKENIKKNKSVLRGGAITVSNHVFYWDFLCVLRGIRPHLSYFPAWKTNFEGPNRHLIRMSGGIPVPDDDIHAMMKFNRAIEDVLKEGKCLHFFPEGSMWFFYPDIRPLKKAVFCYAVKFDKPVIPITLSFRPRRGITKLFTKKPFVDLHVGAPIYADRGLPAREAAEKLRAEVYHTMQVMNGINPGDETYNTDQNIENYKKTM